MTTTPTTQREADEREGVVGLRPYEFSVCGQSLRWYLKRDVDALLAARASLTPTAPAGQRPTDDDLWEQTLRDRDTNAEWADKLANAIAAHFGADIGEHSNMNCPWAEALEAIECATPTAPQAASQQAGPVAMITGSDTVIGRESRGLQWVKGVSAFDYEPGTKLYAAPQAATTAACQPSTLTGQPDAAICQPAATTASASEPDGWMVGLEVFKTRAEAEANVRNPDLALVPLYRAPAQQTERMQPSREVPKIKTWQDRTGNHNISPGSVKHMIAEIAELRAALTQTYGQSANRRESGE